MNKRFLLGALVAVAVAFLAQAATASRTAAGGGQIVFGTLHAGEDEIWVMNADGTNKHNLTRHDGAKISDTNPRFSPDGRQIAYSSDPGGDREIWVMNADGSGAHQLTKLPGANFPSWTADGKAIVFQLANSGDSEIYRINVDGSGERRLTNTPGVFEYFPAFSPDGTKLAYTACKQYPVEAASFRCSTHVMNVDGSGDTNLAFPPLALPFPITDDFNNDTRNVDLWSIIHEGTGGYVQWANGRLELTIAADGSPTPDAGSGSNIGAHVGANCLLNGDFDAQADYQLL